MDADSLKVCVQMRAALRFLITDTGVTLSFPSIDLPVKSARYTDCTHGTTAFGLAFAGIIQAVSLF